jgi:hypothetical protein
LGGGGVGGGLGLGPGHGVGDGGVGARGRGTGVWTADCLPCGRGGRIFRGYGLMSVRESVEVQK